MKSKFNIKKLIFASMFLCIGFVLPLFTSGIKEIGDSLLPMHIPVMLCGLVCGSKYGLLAGAVLPILRSLAFSMPPIYPNAVWMAVELATYGFVIGLLYRKNIKSVYISLITAMIAGRITWGITKAILLNVSGKSFTIPMFIIGGFIDAIPGIILQFILIPSIMAILIKKDKGVSAC